MIHCVVLKEGENMKCQDLLTLSLKQVNDVTLDGDIEDVYIGDLLSEVMASGQEGMLWLTVQKHLNVIAIAHLHDFAGIVFVQDHYPDGDAIDKATDLQIPLFVSDKDAFTLAKELITLGL
ncbi:hypothetical protein NMU03_11410 [Allocoprobacillus halotolerans]|uniref:DRTGG domain-containing protein n=1 Tax=Allocoprobacillus halotolerans TaxID=2944914 RepID=A0ABY5I2S7_9FIRM|nr:hypothetical protein [Allocoprobacillus halotolerans]UTY38282.1 hypothetical protein NMU03_11410 [Allocoprobacillus halotolerans]